MLQQLSPEERLRLMKFVCSFAWADLAVREEERGLIGRMTDALALDAHEVAQVEQWLRVPPPADEVDPTQIPKEHRQLFLDAIRAVVVSDGQISANEAENLALFEALVR